MQHASGINGVHRLPDHLANQIAAGEVVQRPESVVKELVENAIDAGALHVTVIIADAGKNLIQVIDDGSGMKEDDALLAFERHATSKIATYEDLELIHTLGFRGEALPSIASVAHVELKTRTTDEDTAIYIRVAGGILEEHSRAEGAKGTSIAVRNLFFNTPARRQFLKSNTTEYRHIADCVQRFILSYPNIRITFISDGGTVIDAQPGTLRQRITAVFGEKTSEALLEIGEETDLITISGFIGRPGFTRKTRGEQFLFVNGRYVVNRSLNYAIVKCYENMIASGEYPLYILFLNIDSRQVDVNVHPSKLEVKFSKEKNIFTILNAVVRQRLFQSDLTPSMEFREQQGDITRPPDDFSHVRLASPDRQGPPEPRYDSYASLSRGSDFRPPAQEASAQGSRMDARQIDDLFRSLDLGTDTPPTEDNDGETLILPSEQPVSDVRFLWQLHNKYIFAPIKSGLMIIDQHVAHERILYERALAALEQAAPFSQQLLFEHNMQVSASDHALLKSIKHELEHLGFVLRINDPDLVTVEAVPQEVRPGMEESILEEMLEQYKEYQIDETTDIRHNVAASYGCRTAIKAGDKMSAPEMQTLIDQLFATSNPYVCPHGRPVIIKLSLEEIDRRFGRSS